MKNEEEVKDNPNDVSVHSFKDHNFSILPDYMTGYKSVEGDSSLDIRTSDPGHEVSEIIYHKLNSISREEDKEEETMDDLGDTTGDGGSASPRFNTDRELVSKIIVEPEDDTIEEFITDNFSIVKCHNVTTVSMDGKKFSYMTDPANDKNFFFIKMDENYEYSLVDESTYIEKFMVYNRAEYSKLRDFTDELNRVMRSVVDEVKTEEERKKMRDLKYIVYTLFACFIFLILFYIFFNFFSPFINNSILITFAISAVLLIAILLQKYRKNKAYLYNTFYTFIRSHVVVDKILTKWNREYFYRKGIRTSVPLGLQYIQLNLRPNLKLFINDHEIYN